MEDRNEGLANALVRVAGFAAAWLRGGQPATLPDWDLEAMPGTFSAAVIDAAGQQVPLANATRHALPRATVWSVPPPEVSEVEPGVWYQWVDGWSDLISWRTQPGGHYPGSTDLLAEHRGEPRVKLLFTMAPPPIRGARQWMARSDGGQVESDTEDSSDAPRSPNLRRAASLIEGVDRWVIDGPAPVRFNRLARPGSHRARAWQQAWGGRAWGAVIISARGYPDLRALQVAVHERWISEEVAYREIGAAARRTHLPAELIDVVVEQLVNQARRGDHTPAYPIGKSYLERITRKAVATLPRGLPEVGPEMPDTRLELEQRLPAAGVAAKQGVHRQTGNGAGRLAAAFAGGQDRFDALTPSEQLRYQDRAARALLKRNEWSPRARRRVALQLAGIDGIRSLSVLGAPEREDYEDRAVETLQQRRRLRVVRQSIRDVLASRGVSITQEAVGQFIGRHTDETPEQLGRSIDRYLARPRAG